MSGKQRMDLRPESFERIHWCRYEPMEVGLYLVANDFTSFIESLRREE
jgi:hypothetical protein